jgi:hypothetical protein
VSRSEVMRATGRALSNKNKQSKSRDFVLRRVLLFFEGGRKCAVMHNSCMTPHLPDHLCSMSLHCTCNDISGLTELKHRRTRHSLEKSHVRRDKIKILLSQIRLRTAESAPLLSLRLHREMASSSAHSSGSAACGAICGRLL